MQRTVGTVAVILSFVGVVFCLNIFPIGSNVNLSCGGGHLGLLIGIKNLNFVEDLPVINGCLNGMTWFNIGPYGKNVLKDIWDN
jgi:hypothetical protein